MKRKQCEDQGESLTATLEDVVMVRNESGELKRVEVDDDAEND